MWGNVLKGSISYTKITFAMHHSTGNPASQLGTHHINNPPIETNLASINVQHLPQKIGTGTRIPHSKLKRIFIAHAWIINLIDLSRSVILH